MPNWSPWSIPNYSGPYEFMPDQVRDAKLSDAIQARYPQEDPKASVALLAREMGLDPYTIKMEWNKNLAPTLGAVGQYQKDAGRVVLQGSGPKQIRGWEGHPVWDARTRDHFLSTMAHEMGHAADDVLRVPAVNQSSQQTRLHHSNFKDFEPDMADSLNTQSAIEMGLPSTPVERGKFPWLRQVVPLSSNRLASPWSNAPQSIPPEIYNGTRTDETADQYIRDIQEEREKAINFPRPRPQ